jgi:alpha-D-xyloside xylohydrolase
MSYFDTTAPAWNDIPPLDLRGIAIPTETSTVSIETTEGPLIVSLHSFGVRLRFGDRQFGDYGMLAKKPEAITPSVINSDNLTIIEGGGHLLKLHHQPLSFELFNNSQPIQKSPTDSHFVRRFRLPPVARVDKGWFVSLELESSEPVYGLGEKWGSLNKRGQLIRSYNEDALGVNAEASYKNTPFAWSPSGWGAFVHTPAPVTHGVGFAPWSQRAYGMLVEDSSMDLFLFSGNDGAAIIESYTELTGRAPVPPLWSLGVILSKAYYKDAEELLTTARAVRNNNMPCDVITLDGRAWQDTDTRFGFEWDPKRYTDPRSVINELKALNFKVCVWEYPLVSIHSPLFKTMDRKGWLLKDQTTGGTYRYQWDTSCFGDVLTPLPDSGIVDFTHPDAYAFWRDSHKPLFDMGVDMIKVDFGEQIEAGMMAWNGDSGEVLHNVYSLLYNRCVYEAAVRYCKSGPFLFSRSSWIGSQRYPAQWGGDAQADWGGLAANLRGGVSWGMSGAPYYATDVGGFYADQRDDELYVRWAQAAVFSAHFRLHGIGPREPWSYGKEAETIVLAALQLRYRLLPYLHKTMISASETGMPVQRGMPLAFPGDRAAWAFEDQFMFGDDMLVAPCLKPGGEIECYLPALTNRHWCKFPSGEVFAGGRTHKLTLPLNDIAVFVPEATKIPLGPDVTYTDALTDGLSVVSYWSR